MHKILIIKKISLALALSMMLVACTTVNPYTGQQETSNAAKGAGTGALAGALIGAMTGDRKTALRGAVLGAAAGGGVGYYMDVQEAKLRQQLSGTGVSVTRNGDNLILNMPGNVTFSTGSANINAGFYAVLDSIAIILKEYEKTNVEIVGHTDSVGDDASNQLLSERRANSVASYFRSQAVDSFRLRAVGYGERYPVANNTTKTGRAQNRRVEITLTPF